MSDAAVIAQKVETFLAAHPRLSVGLGTVDEPCSIAAINLALTGTLSNRVPDCMSLVIAHWIAVVQDAMPAEIRNGTAWRSLLPAAAGTGRNDSRERARLDVLLDHMWTVTLPSLQRIADNGGCGAEWRAMCEGRTITAAQIAATASWTAGARNAGYAATHAANTLYIDPAGDVAPERYGALTIAAANAAAWAAPTAMKHAWAAIDPPGVLARMIAA
jgi:hypothetical protein